MAAPIVEVFTTAIAANTKRKNSGGAATIGGTLPSNSAITKNVDFTLLAVTHQQPTVIDPISSQDLNANAQADPLPVGGRSQSSVQKMVSAGTYAKMTAGDYIIPRVTTKLATVANTTLLSGAADFGKRKSILHNERMRNTRLASWIWRKKVGADGFFQFVPTKIETNVVLADDQAALPTRAIPGELVYLDGSKTVKLDDYKEKTD